MNNTTLFNEVNYTTIPMSVQYIIVSGYVVLTWGEYNFVSNLTKMMLMYLYLMND